MSKSHKNNHYHYAEKFSDRSRRRKTVMHLPRRAVFFAVLVLLIFGVISVTFSTNEISDSDNDGSIIVSVRNAKAKQDLAVTGADVDYAATGGRFSGGDIYFVAPTGWDISNGVTILYDGGKNWTETFGSNMDQVADSRVFHIAISSLQGNYNDDQGRTINFKTGATWFCFLEGSNWGFGWGGYDRAGYANNYTTKEESYNINDNFNVFTSSAKTGTTGSTTTHYQWNHSGNYYGNSSDFAAAYSFNQTYKMQYKVGTESYTDATSTVTPGSASLATSYWNDDYKDGDTSTKTISHNDYTYNRAVKTAPATLTASAGTGFNLVGIYNSSSTRVDTSTAGSYSYTVSGAATYTARFSAKSYTVTCNLTGGKTVDFNGQNAATTPSDAAVSWASGYTTFNNPVTRYYTQSLSLPRPSDVTATGRTFLGWYDNAACTGTAVTSVSATVDANKVYYAKWQWDSFEITYNKGDGSPVAANTITGYVSPATKQYGVDYTITNSTYSRSGYTQNGWSSVGKNQTSANYPAGGNYDGNADLTLYPVWTLNTPTATLTGGNYVVGDTNGFDLSPSITSVSNSNISQTVDYHWTGPTGNDATVTHSDGTSNPTASSAIFKTTMPGTYTVYVTVENSSETNVTNANNKVSVNSAEVTINVLPTAPLFTLNINCNDIADPTVSGDDSTHPYLILLGSVYDFTATVSNPVSGYTYEWSATEDFTTVIATGTTITFNESYDVSGVTQNYEQTHAGTLAYGSIETKIYCRAKYISNSTQYNSGGYHSKFYLIEPLVEKFKYVPFQKIYNNSDSAVSLSAQYNMHNPQGYTTDLIFSPDNDFVSNYVVAQTILDDFMEAFFEPIKQYFYPGGPKYFRMDITADINNHHINSTSFVAHTTVGTADSEATKPLYFYNKTSMDLSDYQVMCYWIEPYRNDYGYQIAQDMKKDDADHDGHTYRVNIPETATKVQFALVRLGTDDIYYYGTPGFANGTFTFSAPHYAGSTNLVELSENTRVINTDTTYTTSSQTVGTNTYPMYNFGNCTVSAYATYN